MSSVKKTLIEQGMKVMSDPRVMKVMQDERVMKAVMAAVSMPGKAQSFARAQLENIAKAMALATESEVTDLRRTVRKLEDELARLKSEQAAPGGSSAGGPRRKTSASQ
jgi:polyhydroxyalkanoate synthesis regulator phasin